MYKRFLLQVFVLYHIASSKIDGNKTKLPPIKIICIIKKILHKQKQFSYNYIYYSKLATI